MLQVSQWTILSSLHSCPPGVGKDGNCWNPSKRRQKPWCFTNHPNRLLDTIDDVSQILGDRQISISRELTKMYEETIRGSAGEILESLQGKKVKGEVTLVIAGAVWDNTVYSTEEIRARFQEARKDSESSTRDIVDALSEELDMPRKEIYKQVIDFINETDHTEAS